MEETILEINNLSKSFKKVEAVKNVSLRVMRGEVFGILGPNGSGKTTTLAMLLGILQPSSGSFSWFENGKADANRMRIGTLLETPNFYPFLNAFQNLKIVATIKEMENADERILAVLTKVDLLERGKRKFRTYSLGMKQRLAVAAALLSDPEVLVLDEPTNGLDPMGIIEMRDLIKDIAKEGKTIIIASHILDEIEKICSHVAILKNGQLLSTGTLEEIMRQQSAYLLKADNQDLLLSILENQIDLTILKVEGDTVLVQPTTEITGTELNKRMVNAGLYLSELREYKKNLETIFIETVQS